MRNWIVAVTLVVTAVISPRLRADDQAKPGDKVAERLQDLNLTDEQEAKIASIQKECQPKIQEAAKDLATVVGEERDKIGQCLTPEQKQKLETMKEERKEGRMEGLAARLANLKDLDLTDDEKAKIQDIRAEYRPRIKTAMAGFKGILTPEQQKLRAEGLEAGKTHREILASLNLTDDQKTKVADVCKDVRAAVQEEMGKIKDVLSEEQQAKLPELKEERKERVRDRWAHRIANLQELNLSDEQKSKIEDVRKEYRPKVHDAGNKLRGAVREEVDMILAVIKG